MSKHQLIQNAIDLNIDKLFMHLENDEITLFDIFNNSDVTKLLNKSQAKALMLGYTFEFFIEPEFFDIVFDIVYDEYHGLGYAEVFNHLLEYQPVFYYVHNLMKD